MYPTYHNMQLAAICRCDSNYKRGDVIAFHCAGLNAVLVKRIVASGGDSVLIENGELYVNGERSSFYLGQQFDYAGIISSKIILQQDQYFVIGDNINESKDSRYEIVGMVTSKDIIGKIVDLKILSN